VLSAVLVYLVLYDLYDQINAPIGSPGLFERITQEIEVDQEVIYHMHMVHARARVFNLVLRDMGSEEGWAPLFNFLFHSVRPVITVFTSCIC